MTINISFYDKTSPAAHTYVAFSNNLLAGSKKDDQFETNNKFRSSTIFISVFQTPKVFRFYVPQK